MRILCISSNVTGWMCRGMLYLLDKHWPGHPPVIVGGYDRPELPEGVEFLKIGEWADYPVNKWSDGLIRFVESQPDEIFVLTFDDFWLIRDVDGKMVERLYEHLESWPQYARIDLTDDRLLSGGAYDIGELEYYNRKKFINLLGTSPETPYQLSFQTGLWRRSELLKYLVPGETPAEAEVRGAHRMSRAHAPVLGTRQAPVRYLIVQQHGRIHIDDPGYQAPDTALLPEDRAELERLGYLVP
jgi:hypothetical protein